MPPSPLHRRAVATGAAAALAAALHGAVAAPANAQDFVEPSCSGFDVGVTVESDAGNPPTAGPRGVMAGTRTYTFENMTTGATIPVRSAGSVKTTPGPGDLTTYVVKGPAILLLHLTDPGGPATTLYKGSVTFTFNNFSGVLTVLSSTGSTLDLCAALD
jgi:hypothetical protein